MFGRLKVSFVAFQRKRLHLTRMEDSVEVFRPDISREFSRVTIGRPLSPMHLLFIKLVRLEQSYPASTLISLLLIKKKNISYKL